MSLLVVGSVAHDSIKTPHGEIQDALGGSAVYFSLAASIFTPVRLVGAVGADFEEKHVDFLRRRNIDVSGLERVPEGKTFCWAGEYSADMNTRRTVSVELNVIENFQPKIPPAFRDSRLVFLANGSPVTQLSVLDQMEAPAFVMADTMDLWIQTQRTELLVLLRRIDGLIINDSEALLLTGLGNLLEAGQAIQELGPARVVIKKGEHGAILFDGMETIPFPAYPVFNVRDPTGAGDSFAGAFMGYLGRSAGPWDAAAGDGRRGDLTTRALKEALAYATVAASFTVEDFGVRRISEIKELDARRRFERFKEFLAL
jgi:sugar/nucleoside kinase (ribokinase family)